MLQPLSGPPHASQQRCRHQRPDNGFRVDNTHIASDGGQQESDKHLAGQFDQARDQGCSGIAEALHTVAQDADDGGQKYRRWH